MKIGDLVLKVGGWGATAQEDFIGLVIGFKESKAIVTTDDGVEEWFVRFCEVINEGR